MITFKQVLEYDSTNPFVNLVIVSDQHYGQEDFDRKEYLSFLADNLAKPNSYLVSIGDQLDCITSRDPRFELGGIAKDFLKKEPDEILDLQVEQFVEDHRKYQPQILGLNIGNHENEIRKRMNTNPHRTICKALGTRNLGYSSIGLFVLRNKKYEGHSRSVTILFHHGFGANNRTEGGAITTYAQFVSHFDVDVAFLGHKHDYLYKRTTRIGVDRNGRIRHKDVIIALTGSFLRTFNKSDNPSWPETKGFSPRFLRGGWVLKLIPERDGWITTKMSEG